jgi:hypothetical protein
MEEEKNQKNLFEFEEPKKPFSKFTNMLPKRDFEGKIALSLTFEKIVFIFIGIVMVMVLVFALGVENGKSRGDRARIIMAAKVVPVASKPVAVVAAPKARPLQSDSGAAPKARPLQSDSGTTAKPYTIVAATFSKKETAQAAVAFLTKEGSNASVVFSDPYYRVCVGSYIDMYGTQVQKDLAKVKRIYKDALVRVR